MTGSDKKTIYTLLKTADNALFGYSAPGFSGQEPLFTDDSEPQAQPETVSTAAAATQSDQLVSSDEQQSSGTTIASIAQKIMKCTRCALSKTRTNVVPGVGPLNPVVLVVGEGPGYEEDKQGEPFVGPAGQLLDKELASIGLSRHTNTFIANIVKCRPPQNRVPLPEEAAACASFLEAQIYLLKPKMILAAGSTAAKNLLKTQAGVTKLRGQFYEWNGIPLLVTYHPSALLRDANLKKDAWADLKMFRSRLLEIVPDYANAARS